MEGTDNKNNTGMIISVIALVVIVVVVAILAHHHERRFETATQTQEGDDQMQTTGGESGVQTSQAVITNSSTAMDQATQNLQAGQAFLASNKTAPGVITTPSGLEYKVITLGTGPKPIASDTVQVSYTGKLIDGTIFDSSSDHGGPIEFPLAGVIPGWTEGLQLMPVGSEFEFYIPSNLAYGVNGVGSAIGPNETLIFDVTLLQIVPAGSDLYRTHAEPLFL